MALRQLSLGMGRWVKMEDKLRVENKQLKWKYYWCLDSELENRKIMTLVRPGDKEVVPGAEIIDTKLHGKVYAVKNSNNSYLYLMRWKL